MALNGPFNADILLRSCSVSHSVSNVNALCHCRLAFQTLEFSDMRSGADSIEPTGPSQLAARCFAMAGYTVVQVRW